MSEQIPANDMVQVGWMGPYGIVPGGMDNDAPDHWRPIYVRSDRQDTPPAEPPADADSCPPGCTGNYPNCPLA